MSVQGGCFCGAVRYTASGEVSHETNCHCSICRRTSAAPFVSWFTVPAESFQFTSGEPTRFKSSEHGTRTFCPSCETHLTFQSAQDRSELDVTICSLDAPETLLPCDHTRTSARLGWVATDGLPSYEETRP